MSTGKALLLSAALGTALSIGSLSAGPARAAQDPGQPEVRFSRAAEKVLVSFVEIWPELAEQDLRPAVRVYGDGRVVVYRPRYLRQSGTFQTWLTRSELDELMRSIAPTLLDFDESLARRELERHTAVLPSGTAEGAGPGLFTVEDATISYFELEVDAYRAEGAGRMEAVSGPVIVAWEALEQDAERVAPQHSLRDLDDVRRLLHGLTLRADLTPVTRSDGGERVQ